MPTSIAITGIRSDALYEHTQYQGWNIGVEYRKIIHPYGSIWLVHFMCLCNWRASEASETLSGVYKFELVRYIYIYICTVGDKIKFPLCTDSPPTCERSCQQKSPKSRPKVASDFRRTLNVIKKVADLFLSGEKIVCARIQFRPKSRACANGTRRSCNFS